LRVEGDDEGTMRSRVEAPVALEGVDEGTAVVLYESVPSLARRGVRTVEEKRNRRLVPLFSLDGRRETR
jgi:hypothetical protein